MLVAPQLAHVADRLTLSFGLQKRSGSHRGIRGLVVADRVGLLPRPTGAGEQQPVIDDAKLDGFGNLSDTFRHGTPSGSPRSSPATSVKRALSVKRDIFLTNWKNATKAPPKSAIVKFGEAATCQA